MVMLKIKHKKITNKVVQHQFFFVIMIIGTQTLVHYSD